MTEKSKQNEKKISTENEKKKSTQNEKKISTENEKKISTENEKKKSTQNEKKIYHHGALETVTFLIALAKDKHCHKSKLCINTDVMKLFKFSHFKLFVK